MKKILTSGLIAGVVLFIVSYGGLFLTIRFLPQVFVDYNNPLFYSGGDRDILFYTHAFVISFALAWFWERFKSLFTGPSIVRGLKFGLCYGVVAFVPVMWLTFSSLDISVFTVSSWLIYGFIQSVIAGIVFAKINP